MFGFWSSYETIKGDSFEKEALMLSLKILKIKQQIKQGD